MNKLSTIAIAALLVMPTSIYAQEPEQVAPYYFKMGLGVTNYSTQTNISAFSTGYEVEYEKGLGFYVVIAKNLGQHFAVELELHRQRANFSGVGTNGVAFNTANSDYRSVMVNIILRPDIETPSEYLSPYIGFGIGKTKMGYEVPASPFTKSDDNLSARQFIIGNRFNLTDNYFIDAEYRYFSTDNPQVNAQNGVPLEFEDSASQTFMLSYGRNF
ncbi:MAG: porin family protein [Oceanospirillaceae bacterium]|nr:porin family protein [Oceanospirillaceae bacterium]